MPKSLIFAAAAPSTGKTGFAIYLLEVIARTQPDKECLFFSLEMEAMHIAMRHIGICAGKKFDSLSKEERLLASCKSKELKASVFDTNILKNGADIDVITTTARMRAKDNKISVIVVDYLGLVKVKGKFERNDLKLTEITDQLGQLAIELNCTVIVLSQINRQAAQRGEEDRCPWPHDAANSSGGHNSASYWLGLDRPEIYRPHEREFENQFVVKCRKNRFGDLHDTIYGFNGGTFGDYIQSPYARIYAQSQTKEQELFS
jgi:replicative DNA helicase